MSLVENETRMTIESIELKRGWKLVQVRIKLRTLTVSREDTFSH